MTHRPARAAVGGLVCLALAGAAPAAAQQVDAWIDARATHAVPPAGVTGVDAATYGMLGGRTAVVFGPQAWLTAAFYGGRAPSAGDTWFSAFVGGDRAHSRGRWHGGVGAEAFALNYAEPFRYRAMGFALRPRAGVILGRARVALHGDWRRGEWSTEGESEFRGPVVPGPGGPGGPPGSVEGESGPLSVIGGALTVERPLGPGRAELEARRLLAENGAVTGTYQGVAVGYSFDRGRASWRFGARVWESPDPVDGGANVDYGFRAGVEVDLGRDLAATADVARSVADPFYGTPGALATSVGASWHVPIAEPATPAPVVAVGEPAADGRRVRFRVRAPDAEQVELVGDFSGWDPLPMRRAEDGAWVLVVTVAVGLHHFAFRIDGERWYVPDDAPGIVDDGWGRRNASVVIEGP